MSLIVMEKKAPAISPKDKLPIPKNLFPPKKVVPGLRKKDLRRLTFRQLWTLAEMWEGAISKENNNYDKICEVMEEIETR